MDFSRPAAFGGFSAAVTVFFQAEISPPATAALPAETTDCNRNSRRVFLVLDGFIAWRKSGIAVSGSRPPRRQHICPLRHNKTTSDWKSPRAPRRRRRWEFVRFFPTATREKRGEFAHGQALGWDRGDQKGPSLSGKLDGRRRHYKSREYPAEGRLAAPRGHHRMMESIPPVQKVRGLRDSHLTGFILRLPQIIHPIFPADFHWNDSARLCPSHVPCAAVGRQNHTAPLPVDEIRRCRKAELSVFSARPFAIHVVIPGIGQVPGVVEANEARVFHAASFFVGGFATHHRHRAADEMSSVIAHRVSQ